MDDIINQSPLFLEAYLDSSRFEERISRMSSSSEKTLLTLIHFLNADYTNTVRPVADSIIEEFEVNGDNIELKLMSILQRQLVNEGKKPYERIVKDSAVALQSGERVECRCRLLNLFSELVPF